MKELGIELKIVCDKERAEMQPIPFALYEVSKNSKKHKGVIIVAKVLNQNLSNIDTKKYSETKWLREEEVDAFEERGVGDFKNTLRKIFLNWDILFKER